MEQREVKGLWIPIEIWKDKSLSWNEKILFLEIDSFTSKDKDCYMSDEYIAGFLGVSETYANKILSSLIKKGYVIKTSFDGRRRYVKSALTITTRQGCTNEQGRVEENDNRPISSNNINLPNKKEKEDKSSLKKVARKQNQCEWRKDYETYKQLVLSAKEQLLNDQQAKQNLLFMYPNADYFRTVLKSIEFWYSEKGWEYKKKSTAKDINMLATLKNNLGKNIVYKNVNDQPIENLRKLNISVNEQGICADGTFIRGAYRYYHSMRDNKDYSIPIQALPMPNERCEFDMKTQSWYLPYENENTDDLLW